MLSFTEENYLKTIYHLSGEGQKAVLTTELAAGLNTKPATVTDMLKKLSAKDLIAYEKYYGVQLTKKGKAEALLIIRKHRLWETFLVEKLGFTWDEVHEVAEQLEHIQSPLLIEKLDAFLGHPKTDPHGHPIPDKTGKLPVMIQTPLAEVDVKGKATISAVRHASAVFLQYLSKIGVYIGATVQVAERNEFDRSVQIVIDGKKKAYLSREASENIMVEK
ncbi:MAG: metal-dependent transcriptional regulator [Cyclobacteriaceae bacterium]|nr:metal-dependent transcriptional regulator [Cyclobacteriaceae bacterium]